MAGGRTAAKKETRGGERGGMSMAGWRDDVTLSQAFLLPLHGFFSKSCMPQSCLK